MLNNSSFIPTAVLTSTISGLTKSATLKASEKLLGEKLDKEIKKAILDVMKVDCNSK